MPLETPVLPVAERVASLNRRYQGHGAVAVLSHALSDPMIGRIALVSSFGAESVVLLHLLSIMDRTVPVLLIDTEMLFAETLVYQRQLGQRFGLSDLRLIRARREDLFARDPDNLLHHFDPDACCNLRKVEPLERGLKGFDGWITGRKRYQGGQRQALQLFEADGDSRIKINPLAHWRSEDLQEYIANNNLPRHPLVAKGYGSIGCRPCTRKTPLGGDARSGRWFGQDKTECGIHFTNGLATPQKALAS